MQKRRNSICQSMGDALPGAIESEELATEFARLADRSAAFKKEVGVPLEDREGLRKYLERNPIAAWTDGKGTGGRAFFAYEKGVFGCTFDVSRELRSDFQDLVREVLDWRLAEYLQRQTVGSEGSFVGRVTHANGRPIILLPDRSRNPGMPKGMTTLLVDGEDYEANFVKIALNVIKRPGESQNVLGEVLRRWFGENAGKPGTAFRVVFARKERGWTMTPLSKEPE